MNSIYNCIETIQNDSQEFLAITRKIEKYLDECDYERIVSAGKKGARISSDLYLMYRELLLSLHEFLPTLPLLNRIPDIGCETMGISVEQIGAVDFPAYKITLPMLLPNMRRRKADFNNAMTVAVSDAVERYCRENGIRPFHHATVMFLSYCGSFRTQADNDNKEASVIINSLIGHFIRDDSPGACNTGYYYKEEADDDRTEIYVADSDHEIELLTRIHSIIKASQTGFNKASQTD